MMDNHKNCGMNISDASSAVSPDAGVISVHDVPLDNVPEEGSVNNAVDNVPGGGSVYNVVQDANGSKLGDGSSAVRSSAGSQPNIVDAEISHSAVNGDSYASNGWFHS